MAKTYKLSPSSLSLLKDCPRCFYDHFNGTKRPRGIFPSLPSGMDKMLKEHFEDYIDSGELPPVLQEYDECFRMQLYGNREQLSVWQNNFKGIQYTDDEGNVLRGAVDSMLVSPEKKLVVLDYKTRGFPLKEDTAAHYQNQIDIYNYLLRQNGEETEDFGFLLFYMPGEVKEDGNIKFNTDLVTMAVNVDNAREIFERGLDVLNGKRPSRSDDCDYCCWLEKAG